MARIIIHGYIQCTGSIHMTYNGKVSCVVLLGVVVGNKVGVVIGGCGQSVGGVGDFHVKSLDEIKAEKRKRLVAAEVETAGRNEGVCVCVFVCVCVCVCVCTNQGVQGKCIATPTRTTSFSKEKGAALVGTRTHDTLLSRQSALPTMYVCYALYSRGREKDHSDKEEIIGPCGQ